MTTTTMDRDYPLSPYPIAVSVEVQTGDRNRLTTALRPILSIPHMILVGPGAWFHRLDSAGLIGAAAYVLAIVNWFAILVTGESIKGIRDFQLYYLRWRTCAVACQEPKSPTLRSKKLALPGLSIFRLVHSESPYPLNVRPP